MGDSNRDNIEEKEQKKFQNVSSMSNKEIHNLLEEEVNRIKENKTKSEAEKLPKEKELNMERETNSNDKEYEKINKKKKKKQVYPESYLKEISYEGSLLKNMNGTSWSSCDDKLCIIAQI